MLKRLILLSVLFTGTVLVLVAQGDVPQDVPDEIEFVLANLSQSLREDISLDDLTTYEWQRQEFADTSLGCPQPGQAYTQVMTPGYRFLIEYDGTRYDYRVSEGGNQVILCGEQDTAAGTTCEGTYVVMDNDTLFDIAQTCNTTVQAIVDANTSVVDRDDIIIPGQELIIPGAAPQPQPGLPPPYVDIGPGPVVAVFPQNANAGDEVEVIVNGFPGGEVVDIGLGRAASEYDIIQSVTTDMTGSARTTVVMPDFVEPGGVWGIVGVTPDNNIEAVSNPIFIVDAGMVPPGSFESVTVYFVAVGDARQQGQAIGCDDSLVPVDVTVQPTIAPLTAALRVLLTEPEDYAGYYNALAQSNLVLDSVTITNGVAQIDINGALNVGGTCDAPRIRQQLRQTALQYGNVDTVEITINTEPLDDLLSAR